MHPEDLKRMSTQIAQFFEPYPETKAVSGVAEHLLMFWDPTMRAKLIEMRQLGTTPLHPLVERAVDEIAAGKSP